MILLYALGCTNTIKIEQAGQNYKSLMVLDPSVSLRFLKTKSSQFYVNFLSNSLTREMLLDRHHADWKTVKNDQKLRG